MVQFHSGTPFKEINSLVPQTAGTGSYEPRFRRLLEFKRRIACRELLQTTKSPKQKNCLGLFIWRLRSESNRRSRICNPVHNHSATQPLCKRAVDTARKIWSGKRDSNSRPRPWQGRALPTELFPRRINGRHSIGSKHPVNPLIQKYYLASCAFRICGHAAFR